MRGALLLGAIAALSACGGDDRPASWRYIHAAVIRPNCTTSSCHSDFNAQAGVKLHSAEASYSILVGRPCEGAEPPGGAERNYVFPGDPARSRLMHLLLGEEVPRRMPPDKPLPQTDIDLVERWILEGAPCN